MRIPSEGCWKDIEGWVYRHAQAPHGYAFEKWTGADWSSTPHPGTWDWTPCDDPSIDNAPRNMSPEVRLWMREHPGRRLVGRDEHAIWWDEESGQYRWGFGEATAAAAAHDCNWPNLRPADGKGW